MFRRMQGLRLGLEHRRSPFIRHPDIVGEHHLFIYLTGRGEYSYLFPQTTESDIIDTAAQSIPVGYTQLWILEWINAVQPEPTKKLRPFQVKGSMMIAALPRIAHSLTGVPAAEPYASCLCHTRKGDATLWSGWYTR
jgi:hypothetical protein